MRTARQDLGHARTELEKWQSIAGFAFTPNARAWAKKKAALLAARIQELEQQIEKETPSHA